MSISKKYQKDYKNVKFDNPRILRRRENRKKFLIRTILITIAIVFVALVYFILYSPVFEIKDVTVNGLDKIKPENIHKIIDEYRYDRSYLVFWHNNWWVFDKHDLKAKIGEYYYFDNLKIKKRLPNKVIIELSEKESAINWLTNNMCFHLDLTGTAIEYCEDDQGLIKIKDQTEKELMIGEIAIEKPDLQYILDLDKQAKIIIGDKYNPLTYEKNGDSLIVETFAGPEIRFNCNMEVGEQVSRLDLLLKQTEVYDQISNLNYIDLRFGEKVFYQ